MKWRVVSLIAFLAVLALGCKESKTPEGTQGAEETKETGSEEEITVLCGASFRPPMEKLVAAFGKKTGVKVYLSFGQSEDHLPQVKIGKTGDVFVSHDPFLDYTKEAGALLRAEQVGFVAPVVVVRKGNPGGVKSIQDLAKPGVRVALPNPEFSTCGEMLFKLLEKKGIKEAVVKNAGNAVFRSHSQTGNALTLGTRDAGVMWNGIAHNFLDAIEIVPTPYEYDKVIRVWVIGLKYTEERQLVEEFLDFCKSDGKAIFEEFGYVK
ncbi:substrate-binding domain-containing protein [bacterium]|nr:substrate-binding domain-containing protein [bacterium]